MIFSLARRPLPALALLLLPALGAQAEEATPVSLPVGASALQETYEDWQVSCAGQGATKHCALTQQQADGKTRQRMLAIELHAAHDDKASGILVLPFGLALEKGVALQVDDASPLPALHFRTCLPAGCLVPLAFDGAMLAALRQGSTLKVKASADGGAEAAFTISLNGFVSALDRTAALAP